MSETVNSDTSPVAEVDIAGQIIKDPEIRKLPAGSEEYMVAVKNLAEKKAEEATADADGENRKKPKGLEKRFSELTSARDAEKARADALEKRLADLEARPVEKEAPTPDNIPKDEFHIARPRADSFSTYDDYMEALADWKMEKRDFDRAQEAYVKEVRQKQVEVLSSWDAREQAAKERYEGFDQLVDTTFIKSFTGNGGKTAGIATPEALTFLFESDAGPDLLYELAEDDDKLDHFKSMSAVKQVAYLSRLEAKYDKDEKQTAKVTKAPAPSKPLPKGKAVAAKSIDPRNGPLSFADYQEWRKQQSKRA